MKRILIYSKKCQSSSNLIILLKNINLLLNFEMICLEELIANNRILPPNIKMVPALIMPEMNLILQGKETFEWVEKMRLNIIKSNIARNMQQSGPNGFTNIEMGGFSDNFAYTMTDLAQPKSFLPYGKDDEYAIYTGIEIKKLKDQDINKLLKDSEKSRKDMDKQVGEIYDNNRKDAILNYEKQKILSSMNN